MYKFISLLFITLLIFACSDKGTDPPVEDNFCEITDTTSHDFVFEVDTLGTFPSALFDVAALDENNVWFCGALDLIEGKDSSDRYNAVKWNGTEYEYFKIEVLDFEGNPSLQELRTTITFSENDIWFFSGSGSYVHWDGIEWFSEFNWEQKGAPKKAWGSAPDNFFIVGQNGSITHYDGTKFTLMDSGTERDLHDVTGYVDPETQTTHVWVAGELILLYYDGVSWSKIWDDKNPLLPDRYNHPGALFVQYPSSLLIAAYFPVNIRGYCLNVQKPEQFKQLFSIDLFAFDIAGEKLSDLFITGSSNLVAHFNGKTAKLFSQISGDGNNTGVAYIYGHVFIAGRLAGQQGLVIRGKRQ